MMAKTELITKDMTMGEIIEKYPASAEIMLSYGLHCVGCHVNPMESLRDGAKVHGMDEVQVKSMLDELNDMAAKEPVKEVKQVDNGNVSLTKAAADKITALMKAENAEGGLRFGVTAGGCSGKTYIMDFSSKREGDIVFEEHGVKIFVDPKDMEFLNDSKIDYVESLQGSGFKIDNPNVSNSCGCGKSVN